MTNSCIYVTTKCVTKQEKDTSNSLCLLFRTITCIHHSRKIFNFPNAGCITRHLDANKTMCKLRKKKWDHKHYCCRWSHHHRALWERSLNGKLLRLQCRFGSRILDILLLAFCCAAIERNKLLHTDTFFSLFLSRISESNQCSKFIQVNNWK